MAHVTDEQLGKLVHQQMDLFYRFERNAHGHIVLTLAGLDLTGRQEIERLEAAGFRLMHQTKSCLCSIRRKGSYYKNHRLVTGQRYKIALMPTREIERDSDSTTVSLLEHDMK